MTISELSPLVILGLGLLALWEVVWKGIALWRAGRNNHLAWFIVLLIFNTAGVLPIAYLWFVDRRRDRHLPPGSSAPTQLNRRATG